MKTETTTTPATTPTTPTFTPITRGDKYYDATPERIRHLNSQYPDLLPTIYESGLINGSKFFKLYLSHHLNINDKLIQFPVFLRNIATPKNLHNLTPANPSGLHITNPEQLKKSHPGLYNTLKQYPGITILTITPVIRGTEKKRIHFNSAY